MAQLITPDGKTIETPPENTVELVYDEKDKIELKLIANLDYIVRGVYAAMRDHLTKISENNEAPSSIDEEGLKKWHIKILGTDSEGAELVLFDGNAIDFQSKLAIMVKPPQEVVKELNLLFKQLQYTSCMQSMCLNISFKHNDDTAITTGFAQTSVVLQPTTKDNEEFFKASNNNLNNFKNKMLGIVTLKTE